MSGVADIITGDIVTAVYRSTGVSKEFKILLRKGGNRYLAIRDIFLTERLYLDNQVLYVEELI